jgi:hypothetical protein
MCDCFFFTSRIAQWTRASSLLILPLGNPQDDEDLLPFTKSIFNHMNKVLIHK